MASNGSKPNGIFQNGEMFNIRLSLLFYEILRDVIFRSSPRAKYLPSILLSLLGLEVVPGEVLLLLESTDGSHLAEDQLNQLNTQYSSIIGGRSEN